ncbi:FtsQ-type POTRA domain-containing protein [Pseudolysinimonas sp.]|uniref:FtsQ-type POTRA domain-containing protein n=1 Tax=Pseudolysinimonas sp. TaxID=2680009 RepID=UPI00286CD2F6|nr:FtsQ-type POTRA domain-containing protein [Pseudolysinimonas sp.]
MKRPQRPAAQPAPVAAPPNKPQARPPAQRDPTPETGVGAGAARRRESASAKAKRAEVKRFTRHARRRRIGWLVVLASLASTAGLIAAAVFSPILALRDIRVEGAARLDPAVVAEAVSGQLGTPLALLDEARIREDLGQFTSIRSYVTELVPPGTLVIHIVERTPLGVVATATGFDVLDAAGVVLESSSTRPPSLPLLQIDGDGPEGTGFGAMAEVLIALPPEVLAQVDSISARTRDDVTVNLTGSDQRVVWGSAVDSERKAAILAALLARFATAGPGEYDVSAPGSAVFRLD